MVIPKLESGGEAKETAPRPNEAVEQTATRLAFSPDPRVEESKAVERQGEVE